MSIRVYNQRIQKAHFPLWYGVFKNSDARFLHNPEDRGEEVIVSYVTEDSYRDLCVDRRGFRETRKDQWWRKLFRRLLRIV